MTIETILYQALIGVKALQLPLGVSSSGKKFEDFVVQQLYQTLRQQRTLRVFQPRYTLHEDTLSGIAHQFDIVIRQNKPVVIECKFRGKTGIDNLFAFVGKLIDYREPPRLSDPGFLDRSAAHSQRYRAIGSTTHTLPFEKLSPRDFACLLCRVQTLHTALALVRFVSEEWHRLGVNYYDTL